MSCHPAPLVLALALLASCNHCEQLEESLCNDLGPEDCAIWKAPPLNKSGIGGDRMTSKACSNAKRDPTYARMLEEAKNRVQAKKKLDAAKKAMEKVDAMRKGDK